MLADMDGTLKPVDSETVSGRTLEAARALRTAGIDFGPASGRPRHDLVRFFQGDESCVMTGVICGGKQVYLDGDLVFSRPVSHEALVRLCDVIADEPDSVVNLYDETGCASGETPEWLVVPATHRELRAIQTGYVGLCADAAALEVPDRDFYVVGLMNCGTPDQFSSLRDRVESSCPDVELVSPLPGWYDVNPRGWNKANGFECLIESMGIAPDEVVVIGDSENDLTLMNLVPNSVCVANGTESALSASRYHIPSAKEDGPAQLMEALAETNGILEKALSRMPVVA